MSRSSAHVAPDGVTLHDGTYDGCAPCNGVILYWQVRMASGRLTWDGYDLADATEILQRDPSYRLVREDWKNGRLLGTTDVTDRPS